MHYTDEMPYENGKIWYECFIPTIKEQQLLEVFLYTQPLNDIYEESEEGYRVFTDDEEDFMDFLRLMINSGLKFNVYCYLKDMKYREDL